MLDCTAQVFGHHNYIVPKVLELLRETSPDRVIDIGCGEGGATAAIAANGFDIIGVDPRESDIGTAARLYPALTFSVGSAYDDLPAKLGHFSCVVSMEVIEHVYAPRHYARTIYNLLEPGGTAIITTPYHGYLKNLLIAATGKWDWHHTALWDDGHIKFWSMNTLGRLLNETGFSDIKFHRVGRIGPLAKSMVAVAKRH